MILYTRFSFENSAFKFIRDFTIGIVASMVSALLLHKIIFAQGFVSTDEIRSIYMTVEPSNYMARCVIPWVIWFFVLFLTMYWLPGNMVSRRYKMLLRFSCSLLCLLTAIFIFSANDPPRVGDTANINGTILNYRGSYTMLVCPLNCDTCWVQGPIILDPRTGRFKSRVNIGGDGNFAIVLAAANRAPLLNSGRGATMPADQLAQDQLAAIYVRHD